VYVDGPVRLAGGATLDLNGVNLITTEPPVAHDPGSIVTDFGDIIVVEDKTCFGDFDNDGDIDETDEFTLAVAMLDKRNVLCDYNLDCKIGLVDQYRFYQNMAVGCAAVCGGNGAAAGGGTTVPEMAAWDQKNLTVAERNKLVKGLHGVLAQYPDHPDATDMLALASTLSK